MLSRIITSLMLRGIKKRLSKGKPLTPIESVMAMVAGVPGQIEIDLPAKVVIRGTTDVVFEESARIIGARNLVIAASNYMSINPEHGGAIRNPYYTCTSRLIDEHIDCMLEAARRETGEVGRAREEKVLNAPGYDIEGNPTTKVTRKQDGNHHDYNCGGRSRSTEQHRGCSCRDERVDHRRGEEQCRCYERGEGRHRGPRHQRQDPSGRKAKRARHPSGNKRR